MKRCILRLWNETALPRGKFCRRMLLARLLFDLFANAAYGTPLSFVFFLIYALTQLFMVRARVRDMACNVASWTSFYGTGLIVGGVLVLITVIPPFSSLAPYGHYSAVNYIFNKLMIVPFVYLCIYKVPKGGHMIRLPAFFQKAELQKIPARITQTLKGRRDSR